MKRKIKNMNSFYRIFKEILEAWRLRYVRIIEKDDWKICIQIEQWWYNSQF